MTFLAGLREELDRELFTPDALGYEVVRSRANPTYRDSHPQLVIRCGSAADVARGISYARDNKISIVPRGEGTVSRVVRRRTASTSTSQKNYDPHRLFTFPQSI